jgi:hypothetical protein
MDTCIQCQRSTADIEAGGCTPIMFLRRRPMGPGEYLICSTCARRVRVEQDERAAEADRQAERAGV